MFGVRPSGTMCHFGKVELSTDKAAFSIQALNQSHVPAIDVEGEFNGQGRQLRFTKAMVNAGFVAGQRRPATPRRIEFKLNSSGV